MSIKQLRKSHPSWTWTAVRAGGFGSICYIGKRVSEGGAVCEQVEVYACGHIGDFEDDTRVVWYAREGARPVDTYNHWSLKQLA